MKNKKKGIARKILEMLRSEVPFFIGFLIFHIVALVYVILLGSSIDYQLWTGFASSSVLQLLACIVESSATILGIFLGVMLYLIQTKQYEVTREFGRVHFFAACVDFSLSILSALFFILVIEPDKKVRIEAVLIPLVFFGLSLVMLFGFVYLLMRAQEQLSWKGH